MVNNVSESNQYSSIRDELERNDSLITGTPIGFRLDGKKFHEFTKLNKLDKPFDSRFITVMGNVSSDLVTFCDNIEAAYVQSDEINLITNRNFSLHRRRKEKLCSILASKATISFLRNWKTIFGTDCEGSPIFDCRAFLICNKSQLTRYLSWRQVDCHLNCTFAELLKREMDASGSSATEATRMIQESRLNFKQQLAQKFQVDNLRLPQIHRLGLTISKIFLRDNGHTCDASNKIISLMNIHENLYAGTSSLIATAKGSTVHWLFYIFK